MTNHIYADGHHILIHEARTLMGLGDLQYAILSDDHPAWTGERLEYTAEQLVEWCREREPTLDPFEQNDVAIYKLVRLTREEQGAAIGRYLQAEQDAMRFDDQAKTAYDRMLKEQADEL